MAKWHDITCICKIGHHRFRYNLVACHYANQCWLIVNWTLWDTFQWNSAQNTTICIQENWFENVICIMAAILIRPQCVNVSVWCHITQVPLIHVLISPWCTLCHWESLNHDDLPWGKGNTLSPLPVTLIGWVVIPLLHCHAVWVVIHLNLPSDLFFANRFIV